MRQNCSIADLNSGFKPSTVSTARLKPLLALHLRPINQVIFLGSYQLDAVRDLILGWVSHLDAFSGYPIRT